MGFQVIMGFQVGDRVRIKPNTPFHYQAPEAIGTIIIDDYLELPNWKRVRWDDGAKIKGPQVNGYPENELFLVDDGFSAEEIEQAEAIMEGL